MVRPPRRGEPPPYAEQRRHHIVELTAHTHELDTLTATLDDEHSPSTRLDRAADQPGRFEWTSPTGRVHIKEPERYEPGPGPVPRTDAAIATAARLRQRARRQPEPDPGAEPNPNGRFPEEAPF
jgi:hypothetical protein